MSDPLEVMYSPDAFLAQRVGGVSRYFTALFREVVGHGIRPELTWGFHRNLLLRGPHGLAQLPKAFDSSRGLGVARRINWVATKAAQRRCGGVFHPTYYSAPLPMSSVPSVVTVFDMTHERLPFLFDRDNTSALKRRWCEAADLVLTISEATKADLIDIFGTDPERIVVTPLAASAPSDVGGVARSGDKPFVLFVGQRWSYKEAATALAAIAGVSSEIELVFFGGGEFTEDERRLIDALGLVDRVTAVGGDDHVLDSLYRGALALIYPSRYEGFGLPLLEAMARCCPVVCSDLPAHREVAGDAALFFGIGKADQASGLLSSLNSDDALRSSLISRGLANSARFTWQETARRTAEAYRRAMDGRT